MWPRPLRFGPSFNSRRTIQCVNSNLVVRSNFAGADLSQQHAINEIPLPHSTSLRNPFRRPGCCAIGYQLDHPSKSPTLPVLDVLRRLRAQMRPRAQKYVTLDGLHSERDQIQWYWRMVAFASTWMILGGSVAVFDCSLRHGY